MKMKVDDTKRDRYSPFEVTVVSSESSVDAREEIKVSLCSSEADFRNLQNEWNGLLDHSTATSVFLKHQWMHVWWLVYHRPRMQLFILTARDQSDKLVGILPCYLQAEKIRGRVLRLLGTTGEAPEHLDAIVHHHRAKEILGALLSRLATLRGEYDALQLTDLSENAVLLPALPEWSEAMGASYHVNAWKVCPFLPTEGDFESNLQSFSANHRYNFRRRTRQWAQRQNTAFEIVAEPQHIERGMAELFELHDKRWTMKTGESKFANEQSRDFHLRLAKALADEDCVRLHILRSEGRAVAACYCFLYRQRLFYYQTGFDPEFQKISAGMVLLGNIIKDCFQNKIEEFDFLRGEEEYKFLWTKQTRRTMMCEIALSQKAKLIQHLRRTFFT